MRATRRGPHLTRANESGIYAEAAEYWDWSNRTLGTPMSEWDHHCRLVVPIPESAVAVIVARSDWTARMPPNSDDRPYAHCVWQHRAVVEIELRDGVFTMRAHALHVDDAVDAIRNFSGALWDGRPQAVRCRSKIRLLFYRLDFEPMGSEMPLATTLDELTQRLGVAVMRWLDLLDRRPGDPRVVFVSSDGPAESRQFVHELAENKQVTHSVFVYHADARALMKGYLVHRELQRLRLVEQAGMRRVIVVIDDVAELLGGGEAARAEILNFMAAWVHGIGASDRLPWVIGLLPNTTAARAAELLPLFWHPCTRLHLPNSFGGGVEKSEGAQT